MMTQACLMMSGSTARFLSFSEGTRVCHRFQCHYCSSIGSVKLMAKRYSSWLVDSFKTKSKRILLEAEK